MMRRHSKGKPDLDLGEIIKDAESGDAAAQNLLGWVYFTDHNVPQDYSKAIDYYLRAATQGNLAAQNNLMLNYMSGRGVPRNHGKAAQWSIKGAQGGHLNCQRGIARQYLKSQGVPHNPAKAYAWCLVAMKNGDRWANALFRNLVKLTLTKAQYDEARTLAMGWEKYRTGGLAVDDSVL